MFNKKKQKQKGKFTLLPRILQPFFAYFATCDLFCQFEMFQENDLPGIVNLLNKKLS